MISIQHYRGNIIHSIYGDGTQPNKDFKIFKRHRVNDHVFTLHLSMGGPMSHRPLCLHVYCQQWQCVGLMVLAMNNLKVSFSVQLSSEYVLAKRLI